MKLKTIFARVTKAVFGGSTGSTWFIPRKQAGVYVDEHIAMTYSAIFACVRLLTSSVGVLPWTVHQREQRSDGRYISKIVHTHPASTLLGLKANDEMDAQTFRETILAHALVWGNGYAEIERDKANRPVALWPITPDRVTVDIDENGRRIYKITNKSGSPDSYLRSDRMFHLKGLGYDGYTGYSVVSLAARAVGMGLAAEEFGASLYENDTILGTVFKHPNSIGVEAYKRLNESLTQSRAGVKNAHKPMILEEGMDVHRMGIPPDDAQFIESRKFQVAEIARWYGVPLHKLHEMDAATFSNIEHQSIEYVQDGLLVWLKRFEMEANLKLISTANQNRFYTKLNANALLRGDQKTRGEWYRTMSTLGVYSVNDILELEDMNPIGPEGDKRLVQVNLTTLEKIGEEQVQPEPTQLPPSEDEGDDGEDQAQREVLEEAVDRIIRREHHRASAALRRYDGDRSGLIKWMDKFYSEHKNYMRNQLNAPLKAYLNGRGGHSAMIDTYLDSHITAARLQILENFDNGSSGDPIVFDKGHMTDILLRGEA